MRKDLFELLYDFSSIRIFLRLYLRLKEFVLGNVRSKIEDNIAVADECDISIQDSGPQPYVRVMLEIKNRNFSPLQVEAFNIFFSFSRTGGVFQDFFWDRASISDPPRTVLIDEIDGKSEGYLQIRTMLPYYLYFPNRDLTFHISGSLKFRTDAGSVEHVFDSRVRLKLEDLWNRSIAQDRLLESFSPGESAYERLED